MADIVDIKCAVRACEVEFYCENGSIYVKNNAGEVVRVGSAPGLNAQDCLNSLCRELLGEGYYIADPVGTKRANEIITREIIGKYKKKGWLKR